MAISESIKCDIGLSVSGYNCRLPGSFIKKKMNCAVNSAKVPDICKRIKKEKNITGNLIVKNKRGYPEIRSRDVNSYHRQVWFIPLSSARRSINGFF
ncbi:MAG: hypothetical protein WC549_10080 [Actinomycetota bacterium]